MEVLKQNSNVEKDVWPVVVLMDGISDVEKAIKKISVLREELEENSKNVKAEVQASIRDQVHRIHQREVQLLRQVDALISHQSGLLQLQLSRLYQSLGALRTTLQWVKQGGNVDVSQIGQVALDVLQTCHLHYQPTSLALLESSIQSFGQVEAKGTSVNVLIPEEDYGDGDHHVLHKTLDSDFSSKIQMHLPKTTLSCDDYLSFLKTKEDVDCNKNKYEETQKKEKWLRDLEGSVDLGDFEMTDVSDTSESSSIELLPHLDVQENNIWLRTQTRIKDNKSTCNCIDNGNVEIENLDSLNCIPNKVTSHQKSEPCLKPLSVPDLSNVCKIRGSSKCKSFSDCLSEDNCLVMCLKEQMKDLKMQDITKQDCINEVIRATTCMQLKHSDQHNWLSWDAKEATDWLKHNPSKTTESLEVTKSIGFVSNDWLFKGPQSDNHSEGFKLPNSLIGFETTDWIKGVNELKEDDLEPHCQTNGWLSPAKYVNVNQTVQLAAIKMMFARFFQQQTPDKWVAHNTDNRVQLDWLASYP